MKVNGTDILSQETNEPLIKSTGNLFGAKEIDLKKSSQILQNLLEEKDDDSSVDIENPKVDTSLPDNKLYVSGKIYTGWYGYYYYQEGLLANGLVNVDGVKKYFENGVLLEKTIKNENGEEIRYSANGPLTGVYNSRLHVNGKVLTGGYDNGYYYKDGVIDITFTGVAGNNGLYYKNGVILTGQSDDNELYVRGVIHTGWYGSSYYVNGTLANGLVNVDGVAKYFENGVLKEKTIKNENGEEIRYSASGPLTGVYNNRLHVNGKVLTGGYVNGYYYKDGVVDITFTGVAQSNGLYYKNGVLLSGVNS